MFAKTCVCFDSVGSGANFVVGGAHSQQIYNCCFVFVPERLVTKVHNLFPVLTPDFPLPVCALRCYAFQKSLVNFGFQEAFDFVR